MQPTGQATGKKRSGFSVRACATCRSVRLKCVMTLSGTCTQCLSRGVACEMPPEPQKRSRGEVGLVPESAKEPVAVSLRDGSRSFQRTVEEESYLVAFFAVQRWKVEIVAEDHFREALRRFAAEEARSRPLSSCSDGFSTIGESRDLDTGASTASGHAVVLPLGWRPGPGSARQAMAALLFGVLATGAAVSGKCDDSAGYYEAGLDTARRCDLLSPSAPLISALLLLGFLSLGLRGDKPTATLLHSMAASMAPHVPALSASVRLSTLLVTDMLNAPLSLSSSTSPATAALAAAAAVAGVIPPLAAPSAASAASASASASASAPAAAAVGGAGAVAAQDSSGPEQLLAAAASRASGASPPAAAALQASYSGASWDDYEEDRGSDSGSGDSESDSDDQEAAAEGAGSSAEHHAADGGFGGGEAGRSREATEADFAVLAHGISVMNGAIFRGMAMSGPELRAATEAGWHAAQRLGVCAWVPRELVLRLLDLLQAARLRSASAELIESGLQLLAEPFTGANNTLLVFVLLAQLVAHLHGPIVDSCSLDAPAAQLADSIMPLPIATAAAAASFTSSVPAADGGMCSPAKSSGASSRSGSPKPLAPLRSGSLASEAAAPMPGPRMCAFASGLQPANPAGPLLLPAGRRLLQMLSAPTAEGGALPQSLLLWHQVIMAGVNAPRCTLYDSPTTRLAVASSYLGGAEAIFSAGIRAALCAVRTSESAAAASCGLDAAAASSIAAAPSAHPLSASADAVDADSLGLDMGMGMGLSADPHLGMGLGLGVSAGASDRSATVSLPAPYRERLWSSDSASGKGVHSSSDGSSSRSIGTTAVSAVSAVSGGSGGSVGSAAIDTAHEASIGGGAAVPAEARRSSGGASGAGGGGVDAITKALQVLAMSAPLKATSALPALAGAVAAPLPKAKDGKGRHKRGSAGGSSVSSSSLTAAGSTAGATRMSTVGSATPSACTAPLESPMGPERVSSRCISAAAAGAADTQSLPLHNAGSPGAAVSSLHATAAPLGVAIRREDGTLSSGASAAALGAPASAVGRFPAPYHGLAAAAAPAAFPLPAVPGAAAAFPGPPSPSAATFPLSVPGHLMDDDFAVLSGHQHSHGAAAPSAQPTSSGAANFAAGFLATGAAALLSPGRFFGLDAESGAAAAGSTTSSVINGNAAAGGAVAASTAGMNGASSHASRSAGHGHFFAADGDEDADLMRRAPAAAAAGLNSSRVGNSLATPLMLASAPVMSAP